MRPAANAVWRKPSWSGSASRLKGNLASDETVDGRISRDIVAGRGTPDPAQVYVTTREHQSTQVDRESPIELADLREVGDLPPSGAERPAEHLDRSRADGHQSNDRLEQRR